MACCRCINTPVKSKIITKAVNQDKNAVIENALTKSPHIIMATVDGKQRLEKSGFHIFPQYA